MADIGLVFASVAISMVAGSAPAPAGAFDRDADHGALLAASTRDVAAHTFSAESTVGDILDHPSLAKFAPLILPWDGRAYDRRLPFTEIETLLPYHSMIDPETVASSLNRMIADVDRGEQVFYDIYDDAAKVADPSKRNTGLFYYRGKADAPFAIVAPGGGFAYVGSLHEGFPYAAEISRQGYNVFVLRYRAGMGAQIATQDLAAAVGFVFANARALGVSTVRYSLWGSSAGARMVAYIGSHGTAAFGGAELPKPDTVIMAYTSHSDRSDSEPRTFAIVGADDQIAPPANMKRRVDTLRSSGTEVEFKVYPGLGHGFGTGGGTAASGWIAAAITFWRKSPF